MAVVTVEKQEIEDDFPVLLGNALEAEDWEVQAVDGQEQMEAYEHLKRGRCMTCGNKMGEDAQMLLGDNGIVGMWCQPQCMGDIINLTFVERVSDMLIEGIDGRKNED